VEDPFLRRLCFGTSQGSRGTRTLQHNWLGRTSMQGRRRKNKLGALGLRSKTGRGVGHNHLLRRAWTYKGGGVREACGVHHRSPATNTSTQRALIQRVIAEASRLTANVLTARARMARPACRAAARHVERETDVLVVRRLVCHSAKLVRHPRVFALPLSFLASALPRGGAHKLCLFALKVCHFILKVA